MKQLGLIITLIILLVFCANIVTAQEGSSKLKLSGELLTDQRFLLESPDVIYNKGLTDDELIVRKLKQ